MIILAIVATISAIFFSLFVLYANGMRSSPGAFVGAWMIWAAWIGVVIMWLAWWFG
jgi:hypothetical protein